MDSPVQFPVNFALPCIKAIITYHFEVPFRDMLDEELDKIYYRKCPFHISIIFVAVIVEGNRFAVIGIDTFQRDYGPAKVAADVLYNLFRVTKIWFGIDIETIFIFAVDVCFCFFEGSADVAFHFTKEGSLESMAEVSIVEMFNGTPEAVIRIAAFGDKAVDMGIPFQRASKGMEDADETGHEIF